MQRSAVSRGEMRKASVDPISVSELANQAPFTFVSVVDCMGLTCPSRFSLSVASGYGLEAFNFYWVDVPS